MFFKADGSMKESMNQCPSCLPGTAWPSWTSFLSQRISWEIAWATEVEVEVETGEMEAGMDGTTGTEATAVTAVEKEGAKEVEKAVVMVTTATTATEHGRTTREKAEIGREWTADSALCLKLSWGHVLPGTPGTCKSGVKNRLPQIKETLVESSHGLQWS